MKHKLYLILLLLPIQLFGQNVVLPSFFSDNMVLQQRTTVMVWGWAFRNDEISVKPSWVNSKEVKARADSSGKWFVNIQTPEAGGPYTLSVKGAGSDITIKNILIGEVWLCSGQSNMEMPMRGWPPNDTILGSSYEIRTANNPKIRMFTVNRALSIEPSNSCRGSWEEANSEKVKEYSATAYFFGKKLFEELNVPIGLIHTSWGGTPVEAWIGQDALSIYPEYKNIKSIYRQIAGEQKERDAWLEKHPRIDLSQKPVDQRWENLDFQDSICSQPDLYDFEWERMKLPVLWEKTALAEFDGAIWFRKTIDIPAAWANKELLLRLPGIDDIDRTFVNGVLVGKMEKDGLYNVPRHYTVPASLVKAGKLLIAVRVIDYQGGGGIWDTKSPMDIIVKKDTTKKIVLSGYWRYLPVAEYHHNLFYIFDSKTREYQMRGVASKNPNPSLPSVLYNAMINPIAPYKVKGFIWYQGESNVGQAAKYTGYLTSMVESWRKAWGEELPFYFVQIAPYRYNGVDKFESGELRNAQWQALKTIKKSGMAVTLDVGDVKNIHPCQKKPVGERLARLALAKDYGRKIYYSGPSYLSRKIEGNKIRLTFDNVERGLEKKGDSLRGFEIAGADKKFEKAEALIENNTVVVYSSKVERPLYVRYAWYNSSEATLFNKEGLPTATFTTEQ